MYVSPQVLDMSFIRNFMLVIGPISSVFDFLTFYVMLVVLKANEALFQTGWFVEFAVHSGFGDLHHSHARQSVQKPCASCPGRDIPRHSDDGCGYAIHASGPVFRFCPAAQSILCHPGGDGHRLSGNCRDCQERLLPLGWRKQRFENASSWSDFNARFQ